METMLWLWPVWWLVGVACFLFACWCIDPVLRVKDLLVAVLVGGFFGPVNLIFCIWGNGDWLNKRIWPR